MAKNKQLFWLTTEHRAGSTSTQNNLKQPNAAPLAMPMSIQSANDPIILSKVSTINIVRDFNWTNTSVESRDMLLEEFGSSLQHQQMRGTIGSLTAGVPSIILNEYRVTFSSALANMRYQIAALSDYGDIMKQGVSMAAKMASGTATAIARAGSNALGDAAPAGGGIIKGAGKLLGKGITGLGDAAGGLAEATIGLTVSAAKAIDSTVRGIDQGVIGHDSGTMSQHPHLSPYSGLYLGAPSGFRFVLPYLTSQEYRAATSNWKDEGHSALQDFVGTLAGGLQFMGQSVSKAAGLVGGLDPTGLAEKAGGLANFAGEGAAKALTSPLDLMGAGVDLGVNATRALTPGHSLEQTKTYGGYGAATPHNVSFFLSNTHDYEEVVRNWHLMFLLQYQNQPNKNNKISLEPPVMYEVSIPGHYYSPFAYIKSLSIKGLGNTRTMEIPVRMMLAGINKGTDLGRATPDHGRAAGAMAAASLSVYKNGAHGSRSNSKDVETVAKAYSKVITGSTSKGVNLPTHIAVPIPEAYHVNIQIESLVPDSKNFTYHALTNSNTLYTASLAVSETKANQARAGRTGRPAGQPTK
ncbi:hypothetical protein H8E06_00605 [bacterium]|nr:hypothetical protein [bacterium]